MDFKGDTPISCGHRRENEVLNHGDGVPTSWRQPPLAKKTADDL